MRFNSLSEGPLGFLSPASHFCTVETLLPRPGRGGLCEGHRCLRFSGNVARIIGFDAPLSADTTEGCIQDRKQPVSRHDSFTGNWLGLVVIPADLATRVQGNLH